MSDETTPDKNVPALRSPTETLVSCLEDFGEDEPRKVIVIYTTEAGDICWSVSGPYHYTEVIGMLECVKARAMAKFLSLD